MIEVVQSIDIDAPVSAVWAVMTDVVHWCEWTRTVRSIQPLDQEPVNVGNRYLVLQPKLAPARWQVTELFVSDEDRRFVWVTRMPGFRIEARHQAAAGENGCRATISVHFSGPLGPLMGRLTDNLNREYLRIEAEGLKQWSERHDPRHALDTRDAWKTSEQLP